MSCTRPLKAYRAPDGSIVFDSKKGYADRRLELACGQCADCRRRRSGDWAVRCLHEAQMHEKNCFVTLTYDQDHIPNDLSLNVEHWKLFAKRLRNFLKRETPKNTATTFRYLHCGEYGEENKRPHYHALLFGIDFDWDRKLVSETDGKKTWESPTLDRLWPDGFTTVQDLNFSTASYVAGYVLKKRTGEEKWETYLRTNGEDQWVVEPDYATMSRRKGLGESWFDKYYKDVYPEDRVTLIGGKKMQPPAFYDKLLAERDEELWNEVKRKRLHLRLKKGTEDSYERSKTKEKHAELTSRQFSKRRLEE